MQLISLLFNQELTLITSSFFPLFKMEQVEPVVAPNEDADSDFELCDNDSDGFSQELYQSSIDDCVPMADGRFIDVW